MDALTKENTCKQAFHMTLSKRIYGRSSHIMLAESEFTGLGLPNCAIPLRPEPVNIRMGLGLHCCSNIGTGVAAISKPWSVDTTLCLPRTPSYTKLTLLQAGLLLFMREIICCGKLGMDVAYPGTKIQKPAHSLCKLLTCLTLRVQGPK